ncbi:MAG TPA: DUF6065 family protein [Caulobacteraceae bacterium]|nr:DUF6065 family protein [Caulobacteraceae bacterium]
MSRPAPAATRAPALEIGPPELTCYQLWPNSPELTPARADRDWMDATIERFAYRCIPLSIANASGWEISLPFAFEAAWYGGDELNAIQFRGHDYRIPHYVSSHFGAGVITFHTGWLFKTSPGWAVWTRGAPNTVKEGIVPLDGLVETDWLPFPFTMNWKFTRPGVVRFEAGEPFCFITLAPHGLLDAVQPKLATLDDDPKLKAAYEQWAASRADFGKRLASREEGAVAEKWQRTYVQGRGGIDDGAPTYHLSKRRLKAPR